MLLKKLELLDVSTNPKRSGQSGSCDRWNSTSLCKINNFYKSDSFFVDKTSETMILQPLGSVRKIILHIWKTIFCCISIVNKSALCTKKRKTFVVKWHNDSISNDASLLYMVWVRLLHFKTYIRDQKGSEKIARIVRSTLGFTYDEWLENNNCNSI